MWNFGNLISRGFNQGLMHLLLGILGRSHLTVSRTLYILQDPHRIFTISIYLDIPFSKVTIAQIKATPIERSYELFNEAAAYPRLSLDPKMDDGCFFVPAL